MFYKVVTEDLKSLGLRRNPTILQYEVGKWIESPTVTRGKSDVGGIWVCKTISGARKLRWYMKNKHEKDCRIFRVEIDEHLWGNDYRIKTNQVFLVDEI